MSMTQEQIERLLAAEDRAERDIAYQESIVLAAELIDGTRYRYIISNQSDR